MAMTDDEIVAKLREARDNLVNQKLDLTANPKPSYNIDGQEFKWKEYMEYLDTALANIEQQIRAYDGSFEEMSIWHM